MAHARTRGKETAILSDTNSIQNVTAHTVLRIGRTTIKFGPMKWRTAFNTVCRPLRSTTSRFRTHSQPALRVIPALGRKKEARTDYNNQQGGRNELIRDFIFKWTGQERGRKQVSSHLQVLKGYLSDNKPCKHPSPAGSKEFLLSPPIRDGACDRWIKNLQRVGPPQSI